MDTIWKVKKIEGGFTIQKADIKKLGNQLDISVPQEILDKYSNLTMGQRIGISLSIYSGVNWKHTDLTSEGIVPPFTLPGDSDTDDEQFSESDLEDPLD